MTSKRQPIQTLNQGGIWIICLCIHYLSQNTARMQSCLCFCFQGIKWCGVESPWPTPGPRNTPGQESSISSLTDWRCLVRTLPISSPPVIYDLIDQDNSNLTYVITHIEKQLVEDWKLILFNFNFIVKNITPQNLKVQIIVNKEDQEHYFHSKDMGYGFNSINHLSKWTSCRHFTWTWREQDILELSSVAIGCLVPIEMELVH